MDQNEYNPEEEKDLVEFTDDEGNTTILEVLRYFFYNGDEYVVLGEVPECDCDECTEDEENRACYIMKVVETEDDGEENEEFLPIEDDDLLDKLIEIAEANFNDDEEIDE